MWVPRIVERNQWYLNESKFLIDKPWITFNSSDFKKLPLGTEPENKDLMKEEEQYCKATAPPDLRKIQNWSLFPVAYICAELIYLPRPGHPSGVG